MASSIACSLEGAVPFVFVPAVITSLYTLAACFGLLRGRSAQKKEKTV